MFSIKDTLNESFASLASNWRPYLIITAIYSIITTFISFLTPESLIEDLVLFTIILAVSIVVQTIVIFAVFAWLTDKALDIHRGVYQGLSVKKVLPRIIRFIILGIILQFIIVIGFIFLIIPGIYLTLRYSQAMIALIDGKGIFESMKYSAQITKGKKLKLLGIYFVVTIIALALMGLFILPMVFLGGLLVFAGLEWILFIFLLIPIVAMTFIWVGIIPTIYEKLKRLHTA